MNHTSLNRMAASATLHCLTGCAIGEIIGMMIGTYYGLPTATTVILATILAFMTGYALSTVPLLRHSMSFVSALKLVFAADTLSIIVMEITDNAVMVTIPGAMNAGLGDLFFWISLAAAFVIAFAAAFPVNRYLLSKGKGHALMHDHHAGHH